MPTKFQSLFSLNSKKVTKGILIVLIFALSMFLVWSELYVSLPSFLQGIISFVLKVLIFIFVFLFLPYSLVCILYELFLFILKKKKQSDLTKKNSKIVNNNL